MIKKNNVFIVAEAGNNHEGDFSVAKKLIDKASESEQMQSNFKHTMLTDILIQN